ncbi:MAG: 23S rRNA (pseudouridine(1915)-N(3))-methyltransferase RlmH [Taibaiella sp.]|nr:23S rRNA (pseudouridine(1915)-N(3))-methyltransferase RlmH [Taibaiella sp.]
MNVEIWSLGKQNEPYIDDAITHYLQKVKPYANTELVILQTAKKTATSDAERTKLQEEEIILKKLQPHHYLVLLDERGKLLSSPQWAKEFQQMMNQGTKTLVILIGGAFGVTENVRKMAKQCWALSSLVFPHQLVRLIVAEQVYRTYSILNNSPYHHS